MKSLSHSAVIKGSFGVISPMDNKYWCPWFHVPNNKAGINATMTMNIVRFRSTPSRMCTPFLVACPGVKANVSSES